MTPHLRGELVADYNEAMGHASTQPGARLGFVTFASVALAALLASTQARALVFAVNEGVTYRVPAAEIKARYEGIAADLTKLLREPVTVEPVGEYRGLRQGLAEKRWELALVHPAHISIQAIRQPGYRLMAVTKGFTGYKASFMVRSDSTLGSLKDLAGLRLGAPDEDSITSVMVRATLRDHGIAPERMTITYTRYQDAVPFFLENKLTYVGATAAAAVLKDWQAKGGKVLGASQAVPIKHLIASPEMPTDKFEKIQAYFLTLDETEAGRAKLAPTKWKGFEPYDQAAMLKLGDWLGIQSGLP